MMRRRDPSARWRPPSPTASLPLLAAALVAALGLGALSLQPARFRLRETPLALWADPLLPVDALGVAHHDFAWVAGGRDVVLERLMYGGRKTVWRITVPWEARLTGTMDVTGNGLESLCLSATGSSGPAAIVLDHDGQRIAGLEAPRDPAAGRGALAGARLQIRFPITQAGRRKLLCSLDRPAGQPASELLLYDLATGALEWRVPLATEPRAVSLADLDGDGRPEFLVSTISAPRPAASPGPDSALCSVLALREGGERLWSVPLATGFATSGVVALGRGPRAPGALVVATARHLSRGDSLPGRIALIDGPSGRVIAAREFPSGLGRPVSLAGAPPRVAVGSRDGVLRVFGEDLGLAVERRFRVPLEVEECADLDRDGRLEVIAATARGVLILDDRLRTLAALPFGAPAPDVPEVHLATAGLGNSRLAVSGSPGVVADVRPIRPFADPLRLAAVGALALGAGLWTRLRVSRGPRRRSPAGAEAREFLLDYHQIRHETFGRERPFARVRLWAQAQVAGHPLPAEVLESACDEYRRIGAPTLLRFARRATGLGVARARVRRVERLACEVEGALATACAAPAGRVRGMVEGALSTMTALSEECLGAYREVALRDVCRPDHEAQEAILAKRSILDRHGVALQFQVDPSGKQPVLFDSSELRGLIGELIENSARALENTPGAGIRVAVAGKPGDARWVVLRVEDNGPGISPERREALFAPEGSSHPEGGFGLHRAREIAHRWLADLALEEAADGRGAMAKLSLRSLLPHDTVAAGGVPTQPPLEEDA